MVGWIEKNRWLNGYKRQRDGWMYNLKKMEGWKEG